MTKRPRILLVEDEPLIAMMLEDFLDILDYEVAASVDNVPAGLEAVHAGGLDGAVLDVNLRGGEPSWPIADALADRKVPFLLATGGHVDQPPARHAGVSTLAKPFTMDGVETALRALVGR
jgi:DNA-binding response OmpR family regulator